MINVNEIKFNKEALFKIGDIYANALLNSRCSKEELDELKTNLEKIGAEYSDVSSEEMKKEVLNDVKIIWDFYSKKED